MNFALVRRPAGSDCASILAELPDWFGMPEANAAYAEAARGDSTWIAQDRGQVLAVMVLEDTAFSALDVHLLAVRPHLHRQGVGSKLINEAKAVAAGMGKLFLTVKTQGPSAGHEAYSHTRAFYEGVGFIALEEFTEIWGPTNPCLIMVASLWESACRPNS